MSLEPSPAFARLLALYREIADIGTASAVLSWDQETMMPSGGQQARGQVLGTLAGLRHERMASTAFAEALQACREEGPAEGSSWSAVLREAERQHERASLIPADLTRALAEAESRGLVAWQNARKQDDFSLFEAELGELVRLVGEKADALAKGRSRYDALLDLYEPGSTEAELKPLFDGLRADLVPLVRFAAESGVVVDESPAQGEFDDATQLAFGQAAAAAIGFDFDSGRLDRAAHPFCTGFAPGDVRLTWRSQADDFRPAFFGILHEMGHGLYEQGLPIEWAGTPVGGAVGLGVHESQSRLWENLVGRSRAFWEWCMPRFHEAFPSHRSVSVDQMVPALHTVKPSLIRVEADEATYNLHVAARFEIESRLFAGELEVSDLPQAWDDTYQELLGVRAPSAADGVLQDIHWAMGAFGYFPTYTLGNLIAAQLYDAAKAEISDLEEGHARGEFQPLLQWLRDRVHVHGSVKSAQELVQEATGKPLSPGAFLSDLKGSVEAVYGS